MATSAVVDAPWPPQRQLATVLTLLILQLAPTAAPSVLTDEHSVAAVGSGVKWTVPDLLWGSTSAAGVRPDISVAGLSNFSSQVCQKPAAAAAIPILAEAARHYEAARQRGSEIKARSTLCVTD